MGELEKGLALLKEHNACGIFNDSIGSILATILGRPEEAEPFLAKALFSGVISLLETVSSYVFVFCSRGDYASAQSILRWGISCLSGLKKDALPDFIDKLQGMDDGQKGHPSCPNAIGWHHRHQGVSWFPLSSADSPPCCLAWPLLPH